MQRFVVLISFKVAYFQSVGRMQTKYDFSIGIYKKTMSLFISFKFITCLFYCK